MRGKVYAHIWLRVPGRHNVANALAATAAAIVLEIPGGCYRESTI